MKNLQENLLLALEIGLKIPEFKWLHSVVNPHEYMTDEWYVRGNLALKKQDGNELSFLAWWTGDKFIMQSCIVNAREMFTGGQGPVLPANCITACKDNIGMLSEVFGKLGIKITEEYPDHVGFVVIEVVLTAEDIYYKHIHLGATYDYICALSALYDTDIQALFEILKSEELPAPVNNFGASLRVFNYPYNFENNAALNLDLFFADDCYLLPGKGDSIKSVWKNIYETAENLHACYRTDGAVKARRVMYEYKKIS